jgi:hypothetical protein
MAANRSHAIAALRMTIMKVICKGRDGVTLKRQIVRMTRQRTIQEPVAVPVGCLEAKCE